MGWCGERVSGLQGTHTHYIIFRICLLQSQLHSAFERVTTGLEMSCIAWHLTPYGARQNSMCQCFNQVVLEPVCALWLDTVCEPPCHSFSDVGNETPVTVTCHISLKMCHFLLLPLPPPPLHTHIAKLVPLAYGIHTLQISCVVEDDKVGTDFLEENITAFEDLVSKGMGGRGEGGKGEWSSGLHLVSKGMRGRGKGGKGEWSSGLHLCMG